MSEETAELYKKIAEMLHDTADGEFAQLALTHYGTRLAEWYARLLSSLAVIVGDAEVVYAQSKVHDADSIEVVIFTTDLVVTAAIDDVTALGATASPRAVSRKMLRGLELEATTPVNESGRAAHEWPGHLQLRLEYAGAATPIELTGRSFSHHHADNVAPIWALVQGLRRDLAAAG